MNDTNYSHAEFAQKSYADVGGKRMAYIDEGQGDAIVFQHGNPTSSYLWRNVLPSCVGLGRLIAPDLIGMGDSDKLDNVSSDSYSYMEHRQYLHDLYDQLDLGNSVILVLHDWGSALGFDWASQHRDRVQGIVYMEAIVRPLKWQDWPEDARSVFQAFRSDAGEQMIIEKNMFVERVLPSAVMRELDEATMAHYRKPFLTADESRRPTLSWPRQIPVEGSPEDVVAVVNEYRAWLEQCDIPKLFINAEPGSILTGEQREYCRGWPKQQEVTVRGTHFIQEDSPIEIGSAIAKFVSELRG